MSVVLVPWEVGVFGGAARAVLIGAAAAPHVLLAVVVGLAVVHAVRHSRRPRPASTATQEGLPELLTPR
jgi:uncharacterized membrane-anchored protein